MQCENPVDLGLVSLDKVPRTQKKIVAVYSFSPEHFACPYIRLWSPMSSSAEFDAISGCNVGRGGMLRFSPRLTEVADVIILAREFPSHIRAVETILDIAENRGIPVLHESDDDLVNIPKEHPAAGISEEFRASLERIAPRLTGFIVSTEYLATTYARFNKPVHVIPNFVDDRLWQLKPLERQTDKLIIGYMGTPTHRQDLDCVIPSLKKLLKRYHDRIEFWLWGDIPLDLCNVSGVKFISKLNPNYPEFAGGFIVSRPDIAIAPLRDVPFNYSKSSIKFLEYSILRIPGVYSNVGPYARAVEDGRTGLLVDNSESAWTSALERLITDSSLRNKLGGNARISVMRDHALSVKGKALSELLSQIVADSRK